LCNSKPWNSNFWVGSVWLLRNEIVGVGALEVDDVPDPVVEDGAVLVALRPR
jgi:hypothetical protein